MFVNYNFNCHWDTSKKERISQLLCERTQLITGSRVFEEINSINFCEKEWFEDKLSENDFILSNDRLAIVKIIGVTQVKKYELVLEKDILLSMLTSGAGQSDFDNLIVKFEYSIQN